VLDPKNLVELDAERRGYKSIKTLLRTDDLGAVDSVHQIQGSVNKSILVRYVTINMAMVKEKSTVIRGVIKEKRDTTHKASSLKIEFDKAKGLKESDKTKTSTDLNTTSNPNPKSNATSTSSSTGKPSTSIIQAEFVLNLQFQFDKPEIVEWHQARLDSLVDILKSNPDVKMDFTTHTDAIGSDEYNIKLSYRRAQFITNYIVTKGVSQRRIKGIGLGEKIHIAPNTKKDGSDYPEGRQMNRRTDIKLITGL